MKKNCGLFLTILTVVWLCSLSVPTSVNAQTTQNPRDGSIGLDGQVPGPGPTEAAFITRPTTGEVFSTSPITVQGSCTTDLLVQIYRNGTFAGSTLCGQDGSFSVQIDLTVGQNQLVARVFDALNQQGPDSNIVVVDYQPIEVNAPPTSARDQFLLISAFGARGVDPGQKLTWPLSITGGSPPYAVSVNWGDGQDSLLSVSDTGSFTIDHTYELSGSYIVVVKATDADGRVAFLQLVTIVNGPAVAGFNIQDGNAGGALVRYQYIVWPLYILLVITILSFWVGRKSRHKFLPHRSKKTATSEADSFDYKQSLLEKDNGSISDQKKE